ncbi:hypothetical protein [Streptomyces sp. NBC_01618]|uniref:hypothetical protein n=1 Tax=Streptomyces sp. NBC_01618 TaxID=2975900 RepID=UPI00386A43A3|nr:hypothetical protein OH735_10820 [Streptomyces sp. NBC_01618]
MKQRLAQFGVIFLGIEAWVALRDTTSVVSLVIGCVCIAILACCFALRVCREIQTIKDDNKQARDRQEARRREQQ